MRLTDPIKSTFRAGTHDQDVIHRRDLSITRSRRRINTVRCGIELLLPTSTDGGMSVTELPRNPRGDPGARIRPALFYYSLWHLIHQQPEHVRAENVRAGGETYAQSTHAGSIPVITRVCCFGGWFNLVGDNIRLRSTRARMAAVRLQRVCSRLPRGPLACRSSQPITNVNHRIQSDVGGFGHATGCREVGMQTSLTRSLPELWAGVEKPPEPHNAGSCPQHQPLLARKCSTILSRL